MHGIIGRIYQCLNREGVCRNTSDFISILINHDKNRGSIPESLIHPRVWALLGLGDYCIPDLVDYLDKAFSDEKEMVASFKRLFITFSEKKKIELYAEVMEIVKTCETYYINAKKKVTEYNQHEKERLLSYLEIKKFSKLFEYNLYLCIYFGIYHRTPSNFYFGVNYKDELDEFTNEVVCKYGVTSVPGVRAILKLADNGNIFALYELGDMEYYGRGFSHKKNLKKAIMYYQEAAGIESNSRSNYDACHPLALWSLSFIYFNYKRRLELLNCETIDEIEVLTWEERINKVITYANKSLYLGECAAAANILGLVVQQVDENILLLYNMKTAEEYFEYAASRGYFYASNSLAAKIAEILVNNRIDNRLQEKYIDRYIKYLEVSVANYEPWSANRLGLLYLDGRIIYKDKHITFQRYINRSKARLYFEKAARIYGDINAAWGCLNLVKNFYEFYSSNDIDEYFDIINDVGNTEIQEHSKVIREYYKNAIDIKRH